MSELAQPSFLSLGSHFPAISLRARLSQTPPDSCFCQDLSKTPPHSHGSQLPGPWEKPWAKPPRERFLDSQHQGKLPPNPPPPMPPHPQLRVGTYPPGPRCLNGLAYLGLWEEFGWGGGRVWGRVSHLSGSQRFLPLSLVPPSPETQEFSFRHQISFSSASPASLKFALSGFGLPKNFCCQVQP